MNTFFLHLATFTCSQYRQTNEKYSVKLCNQFFLKVFNEKVTVAAIAACVMKCFLVVLVE